jgi:hypothetical protein
LPGGDVRFLRRAQFAHRIDRFTSAQIERANRRLLSSELLFGSEKKEGRTNDSDPCQRANHQSIET